MSLMNKIVIEQLLGNERYFSRVWPYLNSDTFKNSSNPGYKHLYNMIKQHVDKYNSGAPSLAALNVLLEQQTMSQAEYDLTYDTFTGLELGKVEDPDWLISETEAFIRNNAIFNATEEIMIIQDNAAKPPSKRDNRIKDLGAMPEILTKALSVSLDSDLGHDWENDYEKRWLSYVSKAAKVPFNHRDLDDITKGGAERKTLNVILAGVNVGKSLGLVALSSLYLMQGLNVVYISMEMAEEVVAKRIDANLLNITLDDIDDQVVSYNEYKTKIEQLKSRNVLGRLRIKQYPTAGANANTFRSYLNELKLKEGFVPDVVMVDYLGICASSRIRFSENSYTMVKAIAEELRGLAVELDVVLWTGAQTTRSAWGNGDINMEDTAECIAGDSIVNTPTGIKKITEVKVGDLVESYDGFRPVIQVSHPKPAKQYKIRLKSGKTIICSDAHRFPSNRGRLNIRDGLAVGDKLNSNSLQQSKPMLELMIVQ